MSVLLGDQNDVVGVLKRSLEDDGDESAKGRLTAALQALAEDPRYTKVLAEVQEKVDLAFTPTGRHKGGRSIWKQVSEEQRIAEQEEAQLRIQQIDSENARILAQQHREDVRDIRSKQTMPGGVRSGSDAMWTASACFSSKRSCEMRLHRKSSVSSPCVVRSRRRPRRLLRQRPTPISSGSSTAATQDDKLLSEQRRDLAQDRVRGLETGAAEQQRRLREQEFEKEQLRLSAERSRVLQVQKSAEEVQALVTAIEQGRTQIATLESNLTSKTELLQRAEEQADEDATGFANLRQLQAVARYKTARERASAAETRKLAAQTYRQEADSLDRQAQEINARIARRLYRMPTRWSDCVNWRRPTKLQRPKRQR